MIFLKKTFSDPIHIFYQKNFFPLIDLIPIETFKAGIDRFPSGNGLIS